MRRVRASGDTAVLIDWPDEPPAVARRKLEALHFHLRDAAPPGLLDFVAGAASLLLHFDPDRFALDAALLELAHRERDFASFRSTEHEIEVCYGGPGGPDLQELAAQRGMSAESFAQRHAVARYTVAFVGFSPGFAYLSGLPEELAAPRLPNPRPRVPAGSVAIGGAYTGVYPSSTAGGWRLIGRTPSILFDPRAQPPSLLSPGDRVRFVPITEERFAAIAAERRWKRT